MPRPQRIIRYLISRAGQVGAQGPGDPITRRCLWPVSDGGGGDTVQDYPDLRTQRHGAIVAGNIGQTANAAFNIFGTTIGFDGVAGTVISADPAAGPVPGYNDGEGVFQAHLTTSATGNIAGHRSSSTGGDGICRRRHLPLFKWIWRTGVNQSISIDNVRLWMGLFSVLPTTTDDPVGHVAAYRWSTSTGGAGDTELRVLTKDGTTLRNIGSGLALTIGLVTKCAIDMREEGVIRYYVNDILVDETSSNMPGNDTDLIWVFRAVNGNGGGQATLRMSVMMWASQ